MQVYMWNFDEAVALIRKVQTQAWAFGYNLSLGGGVLNRGYSDNDLDIVALTGVSNFHDSLQLVRVFVDEGFEIGLINSCHEGLLVVHMAKGTKKLDLIFPLTSKVEFTHTLETGGPWVETRGQTSYS